MPCETSAAELRPPPGNEFLQAPDRKANRANNEHHSSGNTQSVPKQAVAQLKSDQTKPEQDSPEPRRGKVP